MKSIPNYITISRIIFSLLLIIVRPLSAAFYTIYIICGFSDIMDGFVARRTGTESGIGAKLDSLADAIMDGVLLVVLYPIVNPTTEVIIWIILIAIIRLASIVVAVKKYKSFASIHTYGNKITGLILFIFPMLLSHFNNKITINVICVVASLSAIEELIIQLTSSQLQLNRKSIFIK